MVFNILSAEHNILSFYYYADNYYFFMYLMIDKWLFHAVSSITKYIPIAATAFAQRNYPFSGILEFTLLE